MRLDVVTIFPDYLAPLRLSLVGTAIENGLIDLTVHDLRVWTHDRHRTVDDTPYGGGPGMVMKPDPWGECLDALAPPGADPTARLIVFTPSGRRFDQALADELATEPHLILACGRYEGIDTRVVAYARTRLRVDEVSIGDYVLNGGEAAALVVTEAVARLIPGVIGNPESLAEESHSAGQDRLLEYPVFTKPPSWRGLEVPEVLFSGHHAQIAAWRRERAVALTRERRPDLLPGEVILTRAAAADAGELLTLQRAAYVSEGRLHDSFDLPPLTDDLAAVTEIIATTTCLVARRGGRLVGSAFGRPTEDRGWFIGRLMVVPDLRGQGLGRCLLDEIEDAAPSGTTHSVLITGVGSDFNQAFYARRGYRIIATDETEPVPIVVMRRDRAPGGSV
ncbi:MAG: tRNA (guanosine(37)-N1)-methyltransferase TrmD [Microlunatus sp.]|nr:tRNA (guanosine(37)-N1)-methyltransferase TrmD [Microlunatus sp.]MDN5771343.1 tRNA (guanosine(37)-N1)-methyltransferase TrmD [Microlunatus sp.]MDN5804055.1 tRNA (guanosine(37)-N1)-methyltransferase TrmD [Microlunatus sp.]